MVCVVNDLMPNMYCSLLFNQAHEWALGTRGSQILEGQGRYTSTYGIRPTFFTSPAVTCVWGPVLDSN